MRKEPIVALLFCLLSCQNHHEAKPSYDEVPSSYSDAGSLGQAYSKKRKRLLNISCIEGEAITKGNSFASLRYERDMSFERMSDVLNGELSADVRFPVVKTSVSSKIALSHAVDELSETHTLYWSGINQKKVFKLGSRKITDRGRDIMLNYPENIEEICGDEFISEIQYGAILLATMRVDFLSKEDKNAYGGSLDLQVGTGSIKFKGSLEKLANHLKSRIRVTIHAKQLGGDPVGLFSILSENLVSCSLENVSPCLETMKNLASYGKQEFRQSLQNENSQNRWNVIKYVTQRYDDSGFFQLQKPAKDHEYLKISQIRRQIERSYIKEIQTKERITRILAYSGRFINQKKRKNLKELLQKTTDNVYLFTMAQRACYQDFLSCKEEWQALKTSLNKIDTSLLEIKPLPQKAEAKIFSSQSQGGYGGAPFTSRPLLLKDGKLNRLVEIGIKSRQRVNQLVFTYADGSTIKKGGGAGPMKKIAFKKGEYITKVTIGVSHYKSPRIGYLKIDTNLRENALSGGKKTRLIFSYNASKTNKIVGFYGRAGDEIDRLGAYYATGF